MGQNVTVDVWGQGVVGGFTETLTRTANNGAELELFGYQQTPGPWTVAGTFGSGMLCNPRHLVYKPAGAQGGNAVPRPQAVHPGRHALDGVPENATAFTDHGSVIDFRICWDPGAADAPVRLNGSYLSAKIPPVFYWEGLYRYQALEVGGGVEAIGPPPVLTTVTRSNSLVANDGDTADFVLQNGNAAPSDIPFADRWVWSRQTVMPAIRVAAVNTSGQQNDQFRAFLAGIVLGVAGGAVIALLQELMAPFSRRRDER